MKLQYNQQNNHITPRKNYVMQFSHYVQAPKSIVDEVVAARTGAKK